VLDDFVSRLSGRRWIGRGPPTRQTVTPITKARWSSRLLGRSISLGNGTRDHVRMTPLSR
jgi:hypothetical protein